MNRFSNDFSTLDIRFVATTSSNKAQHKQQTKNGNNGDLHSMQQQPQQQQQQPSQLYQPTYRIESQTSKIASVDPYTGDIVEDSSRLAACDMFRVSKPTEHNQWQMTTMSRGTHAATITTIPNETLPYGVVNVRDNERDNTSAVYGRPQQQQQQHASTQWLLSALTNAQTTTQFSCDRFVETNVSTSAAHVVHGLAKSFVEQSSESNCHCSSWTNNISYNNNNSDCRTGAMRLNVPAAPEGGQTPLTTTTISDTNNGTSIITTLSSSALSSASSSRIHENGTLLGAIVPSMQPSLTIQVNQNNDLNGNNGQSQKQQTHDVVNQLSGISIVNCYRAVPVQIVNNNNNLNNNNLTSETSMIGNNVQIVNNDSNEMLMINRSEICDIQCKSKDIDNDQMIMNVSNSEIHSEIQPQQQLDNQMDNDNTINNVQRTFISTEAQTDDLQQQQLHQQNHRHQQQQPEPINGSNKIDGSTGNGKSSDSSRRNCGSHTETENLITRDQRRRDRRERRQARNARQQHLHPQLMQSTSIRANCEIIPDILHSHVPPPYTTLPMPSHCSTVPAVGLPTPSVLLPNPSLISPLPVGIADDGRFTFPLPIMRR